MKSLNAGKIKPFDAFINKGASTVYCWLELVVMCNLPYSTVENEYFRKGMKYENISVDTLMKYMYKLTSAVEKEISEHLPEKFGLIIDSWSEGSTHYYGLFAVYQKKETTFTPLLTISPPLDEQSFRARDQAAFIVDALSVYLKDRSNVLFLVADNTNMNPATARILQCPFIGCASHRFNLALQDFFSNYDESLDSIHHLMKQLKTLKNGGALRTKTDLLPILRNKTRWSSTYAMLQRFFKLKDSISALNNPELDQFLPAGSVINELKALLEDGEDLESVTKALQSNDINMADVRILFDSVCEKLEDMKPRLSSTASIIDNAAFEDAIVKIISGGENDLSSVESNAVKCFLKETVVIDSEDSENEVRTGDKVDFALTLLKRNKKRKVSAGSKYIDLSWIPPTSNIVERLFSAARLVLTDYRKSMDDYSFECLMFLKTNKTFWDLTLFNKVYTSKEGPYKTKNSGMYQK